MLVSSAETAYLVSASTPARVPPALPAGTARPLPPLLDAGEPEPETSYEGERLNPYPIKQNGEPSYEFEPDDIERAEEAPSEVQEILRRGCLRSSGNRVHGAR